MLLRTCNRPRSWWSATAGLFLLSSACGGEDVGPNVDASVVDAGVIEDASTEDVGPADTGPPPVAPYAEPTLLRIDRWMVAVVPNPRNDVIGASIEQGTFRFPDEGPDEHGIWWRPIVPSPNGALGRFGRGLGWAVTRLQLDAPTGIIAEVDFGLDIYANGSRQPGDVYGSRKLRVPVVAPAGETIIAVRAYGARGTPLVRLEATPDELFLNLNDTTRFDPVVGDASEQYFGVATLNLTDAPVLDLVARVVESDDFEETTVAHPAVAGRAVTQVAFRFLPKRPFATSQNKIPVTLRLESHDLSWSYEREIELTTTTSTRAFRRTFRSPIDHSVQYYGVRAPTGFESSRDYALVLSLHGAGVEAIGQARAYSAKDWAYLIAPTNRRPFGFDWEEWGHLNGLAALSNAQDSFHIDPTRIYVTGHSMGGHGTWHFGVLHPGRFAVVAPSAGWASFESYQGETLPSGPFGRARAHSDTMQFATNLARRGVYILHGSMDESVPVREGRDMAAALSAITSDLVYHEEPGASHWWDGDQSPGVDCVDWPPMFDFMQARTLDPFELVFQFVSPAAWYSAEHSFVTLESSETPYEDLTVSSTRAGDSLHIATTNVRSMTLAGDALLDRGISTVLVDGSTVAVASGPLAVGPRDGKRKEVSGPFNQVFQRPFCFVYPDDGPVYADYAAYLVSYWSLFGNGQACALPFSRLTAELRDERNIIYLGASLFDLGAPPVPFEWDDREIQLADSSTHSQSALMFVFPDGDRLSAALVTTAGSERLLFMLVPFSSRAGLPDYLIWSESGGEAAGFFDSDWSYDPRLGVP